MSFDVQELQSIIIFIFIHTSIHPSKGYIKNEIETRTTKLRRKRDNHLFLNTTHNKNTCAVHFAFGFGLLRHPSVPALLVRTKQQLQYLLLLLLPSSSATKQQQLQCNEIIITTTSYSRSQTSVILHQLINY